MPQRLANVALLFILLAAVAVAPLPAAAGGRFIDDDGSIHEPAIEAIAAAGITRGCNPPTNTRFCPRNSVTRAQMATFLVRALGLPAGPAGVFVDTGGSVHERDIEALAAAGITRGCNPPANDRFCPSGAVTREQMATFLVRALEDLVPIDPDQPPPVVDNDPALVARYHVKDHDAGFPDEIEVGGSQYSPRSFRVGFDVEPDDDDIDRVDDAGPYLGWDVLMPSTWWEFRNYPAENDWFQFTLNRPARLAVAWRADLPLASWLTGWDAGGVVYIDGEATPVYEKDFAAGPVELGTIEYTTKWREMYVVLLAEADGSPTPTPTTPSGYAVPAVNQPCPSWVHASHVTTGPDGEFYQTWHPQLDPVYWCSFGHEHGSDPSLIPGSPMVPYGYVAAQLGANEPNNGFKEFTFLDMQQQHWVRFVVHASTNAAGRVCTQFHTLYVQVYDLAGTELFNVGFKADYGASRATRDTGGGVLAPTNCGYDMPSLAAATEHRSKEINVGAASTNYERWESRHDTTATRNLGIAQFDHTFDIRNPGTHCVDATCNAVAPRDHMSQNGTRRTLTMATWKANFVFSAATALASGEFYTDAFGEQLLAASDPAAVRQYIAPGFSLAFVKDPDAFKIECKAVDPWTFETTCYQIGGAGNRDHIDPLYEMGIENSLTNN